MMKRHKIMIIDDEFELCEIVKETLISTLDCQVQDFQNAKLALQELQKNPHYDLIISDVMMPEMDGITFLKSIRQIMFKNAIIFLTASDSDDVLAKAFEYGVTDFLSKPFATDQLITLVTTTLKAVDALKA